MKTYLPMIAMIIELHYWTFDAPKGIFYILCVRCQLILLCMKGFLFVRGVFLGGVISWLSLVKSYGVTLRWFQLNRISSCFAILPISCNRSRGAGTGTYDDVAVLLSSCGSHVSQSSKQRFGTSPSSSRCPPRTS